MHHQSGNMDLAHIPTSPENTATFLRFMDWLMEHPKYRKPAKLKDWAAENDVTVRTLYNWRNHPQVVQELRRKRERYVENHMPEIVRAAVETAKMVGRDGSADRKLLFEWLGYLKGEGTTINQTQINVNQQNNVSTMSDDKLVDALRVTLLSAAGVPEEYLERAKERLMLDMSNATDDLSDLGTGALKDAEYVELPDKPDDDEPLSKDLPEPTS